ncbi:MAG: DUF3108 domain-containing protein [Sulfuritalea sp.]|nr:DUF3108 domain-containing protein [Sulfuritalea sp.]
MRPHMGRLFPVSAPVALRVLEMPFALALLASALLHGAALIGPGWPMPEPNEAEAPPAIEAVLTRPAAAPEAAPVAKPAPRPPPADKPRPRRVASAAPAAASTASAPAAVQAEAPPAAVPAEPTPEPVTSAPEQAPAPVQHSALPGKGRVRYVVTRGESGFVIGQTVYTWEHDGLAYKAQSVAETTGLAALFKPARVTQSSEGELTAEGLKPHEFRHQRVAGLDTASFDWARRVVAYAGREESILPGTQDMLSLYYQLVLLAPQSGALDLPIATGRKLEIFRIEVLGEETVLLPEGERRAMRLRARRVNDSIELWIAADMPGLPVKIRITDRKGEIFDQVVQDIDIRGNP